jgi:hypothetical protein
MKNYEVYEETLTQADGTNAKLIAWDLTLEEATALKGDNAFVIIIRNYWKGESK